MNLSKIEKGLREKNIRLYISSHADAAKTVIDLGGYEELISLAVREVDPNNVIRPDTQVYKWLVHCSGYHKTYFMEFSWGDNEECDGGVNAYCNTLQECFRECISTLKLLYNIDLSYLLEKT